MQMTNVSFWKIVAGCAVAGTLAAGIVAEHAAGPVCFHGRDTRRRISSKTRRYSSCVYNSLPSARTSLTSIITAQHLYTNERKKGPLEDIVRDMRNRDIRIRAANAAGGPAFTVEFANENPAAAQATVRAIVSSLIGRNLRSAGGQATARQS